MNTLRIGTRGSPLALWQAHAVETALVDAGAPPSEIVVIKTTGDRLAGAVLSEVGGKSVFVKEIEEALLARRIDIAVHSAKDLPGELPKGLCVRAALPREDPRDALALPAEAAGANVAHAGALIRSLGSEPRIGTGSVRRAAQLKARFPDARFEQIRGNVGTRLRKLDDGGYDLLVLAAAGLMRLGLSDRISARLSLDDCLPAPGQGIVAIEAREDDPETARLLSAVNDPGAMAALESERGLLRGLGGDCHVPIGGIALPDGPALSLTGVVASIDGRRVLRQCHQGPSDDAAALGHRVADALLASGAAEILAAHRP